MCFSFGLGIIPSNCHTEPALDMREKPSSVWPLDARAKDPTSPLTASAADLRLGGPAAPFLALDAL